MSDPADRRGSKSQSRIWELLEADERQRRDLMLEMARLRNQLDGVKDWYRLYGAVPRPGQPLDTWIEEQERKFTKASTHMSAIFVPISGSERVSGQHLVTATVGIADDGLVKRLKKSFRRVTELTEMHDTTAAGTIVSAKIDGAGVARITARISSAVAATKISERCYPGISVHHIDGEIDEITLVDRPDEELAKRGGRGQVFAKLYNRGDEVNQKKLNKALRKQQGVPNSIEKQVAELLARKITPDSGDAAKRAQSLSDWQMLYNAGRQQIVGDPRFSR
jgi:hypothetical protein